MTDSVDHSRMALMEHLIELRRRLIYSAVGVLVAWIFCYAYGRELLDFLIHPLALAMVDRPGGHLQYTALTEAFVTRIKISFWAACFIAFPVIASQVWMFVAPGLYKNERGAFLPYLCITPVLFLVGGALAYYVVFPSVFRFLLSFQEDGGPGALPIDAVPRIGEFLSFSLSLIFAFGLSFQMPVALTLMARVGILSSGLLVQYRRYAILGNTLAASLFTPPDAFSMMSLAVPLYILYEISIWSCRYVEWQRKKREEMQEKSSD